MDPSVSVIIVNYNSGDRLAKCLQHLAKQTFTDFETIVIDNASSDASIAVARNTRVAFEFIDAQDNLGFAKANNVAARKARGQWLAFLNPDAYAAPDWLEKLVDATTRWKDVDAFGSTQIDATAPQIIDGAGDVYHITGAAYRGHVGWPVETLPPEGECFAPCAAAALFRHAAFTELGGFDESFFCYGEDMDLGFRLRLQGGRCIQVADARVLHEGSGITGRHSAFTVYYGHRNRIWVYFLNMPGPLLLASLPFHVGVNIYLFFRFCFAGEARAYLRAVRDAARRLPDLGAERRRRQAARRASVADIAKAATWSPFKLMRKEADIRVAHPQNGESPASVQG